MYPVVLTLGKLGSAYLNGHLDEIRLSNIARYSTTFTPMTKAYNTATTPAPTPTIVDISAGEKTVTALGNARMSGTNPLLGNASLYLDGINSYLSLADSDDWVLSTGGSFDATTKLLLHLDNNVNDESGKSVTNNGVTFSSSTKKFGYSGVFNGSSSLQIPDNDDFAFGSGDFTIDFWFNSTNINAQQSLYHQFLTGYQEIWISLDSGYLECRFLNNIGTNLGYVLTSGLQSNTWYHVAYVRTGNVFILFINGINVSQITSAFTMDNYTTDVYIGRRSNGIQGFTGYIDEFRVSKGIARWTSNFSPESSAYTVDAPSDYTIDLWIDPLSLSDSNAYIIGQDDSWKLTLDGTSNKYLKYSVIGGNSIIAPISLSLESWQHVAIVQKDGVIKLYVNGILGASIAGSETVNGTSVLSIGADSTGAHMFNGFIEEVRVSDNARWAAAFTPPVVEYSSDSNTKLLLPLNVQTVPNMVLHSVGYVANYVPTSARVVIFEEDIDTMEPNVDLVIAISRDGGATFTNCTIAKDQEFGDGTLNLFTGSLDLRSQPNGELLVWKLTTQNNKDCRIRGISLNWR